MCDKCDVTSEHRSAMLFAEAFCVPATGSLCHLTSNKCIQLQTLLFTTSELNSVLFFLLNKTELALSLRRTENALVQFEAY